MYFNSLKVSKIIDLRIKERNSTYKRKLLVRDTRRHHFGLQDLCYRNDKSPRLQYTRWPLGHVSWGIDDRFFRPVSDVYLKEMVLFKSPSSDREVIGPEKTI